MRFLGIDAGATYLKGAVLNTETLCVEQVIRSVFPPFLPSREGIREVSPGAILACVSQLLDELYRAAPDACGLFLCGQMHGLVLTSGRGGASSNFITWQDSRASASFAALASRVDPATRQETGNELRPSLPLSTLFFLRQTNQLPAGNFLPASLVDFLAANLCGTRPVTSASNAAAHGCMDVRRRRWHSGHTRGRRPPIHRAPRNRRRWRLRRHPAPPLGQHALLLPGRRSTGRTPRNFLAAGGTLSQRRHRLSGQHGHARSRRRRLPVPSLFWRPVPAHHHPHSRRAAH